LLALLNVCYSILSRKKAIAYMVTVVLRTPADIGALLKERRRILAIDQAELGQKIGVSRLWVNQVERGKAGASLGLVLRALSAVGVEMTGRATEEPVNPSAGSPVTGPDINAIVANARGKVRK
jgi:HTH-type transcriptional regulator/antitoxin HipB